MNKIELLAPAGDMEKLKSAIYFGADAVYFAGKKFGLRAFSQNFEEDEIKNAVEYAHSHNVKCYITVNILAHDDDYQGLKEYLEYLENCNVDGVIVADIGIASFVKQYTNLELHISTQANITNSESAKMWVKLGAKRLVLAREMNINEVRKIKQAVGDDIDIECFCHGAMCISYSGRCLLSNYFTGRDSNRGACVQACRWNYTISSESTNGKHYPIMEDDKGTYILNSKDMCLIEHLKELIDAGITSFKIEGRMKSPYYVATVVSAYKRAFENIKNNKQDNFDYVKELEKTSHRMFSTGFYFNCDNKENLKQSMPVQTHEFMAIVIEDTKNGYALTEMRNRFKVGDTLEVLSPDENFNKQLLITNMKDEQNNEIEDAFKVQQKIYIRTDLDLHCGDMLRKKID